ncbi:MAG: septum formation protein Maf [Clostridiales bacterium]|nr:septum formation protein Maf [Clostridiales bacterium]
MSMLGYEFEAVASGADETIPAGVDPTEAAALLAYRKAMAVAARYKNALVIGADTLVVCGRTLLGKPTDESDALRMLEMLSGRSHRVITGLYAVADDRERQAVEVTRVFFTDTTLEQRRVYVATGEPFDKAGAYGIQGNAGRFIRRIEGCYYNVVGLPLAALDSLIGPLLV